jgi:predicted dithiol-disulfide oxidoreductase (DUF899 family)
MPNDEFASHPIVSHEEWIAERTAFLAKEKEFTRLRDEHTRERRALPWERVSKEYVFDGAKEKQTLAAYGERMGWHFTWVSSGGNEFNRDYYVYFTPEELAAKSAYFNYTMQNPGPADREGHSVFVKDARGDVCHTYSCYDRGNDLLNIHYHYLDMVPKGRDEGGRGPFWVRRRGEYGAG